MHHSTCAHACACSDPQALQTSLTGVLRLCPKLGILPGVVTASPAFLAASRAVQRLAVRREAAEAHATGDPEAMAAVLQKAARLGHMSICRRLEVRGLHDYPPQLIQAGCSMAGAAVGRVACMATHSACPGGLQHGRVCRGAGCRTPEGKSILAFWVNWYTYKHLAD